MCKKLSIILLCLLMITGCSKDKPILYSNLGNQASQNKLTNILNEADLPKENIKQFFSYVNTFNQHATPLIGDFETLEREQPDYQYFKYNSPVEISDQNDSNSLIPSFILIKNLIYTNNTGHADDSYIMFNFTEIIYVFLTIFLYLLKCPQSLILSALRVFCFCGKPHISRLIFLYFLYQTWLKSW